MPEAVLMPNKPITWTPSFISSIYLYQITVMLSTSTPLSVLALLHHQLLVQGESFIVKPQKTATGASVEQPCTTISNKEEMISKEM